MRRKPHLIHSKPKYRCEGKRKWVGQTSCIAYTQYLDNCTAEGVKVKVQCSPYRPGVAQRVGRGIALLFHDRGTRRGKWSAARPGRTLPSGKTRYPFYRRMGGSQGRSGRAENLATTGTRSRNIQPVAHSLYRLSYPA